MTSAASADPSATPPQHVPFRLAVRTWCEVALLSFGGPAAQIGVMHRILVERNRWIGEERFLHALNYCMLLPGPEAQQLAVYIGWLLHGTLGGLVAGTLFILPGFVSISVLSIVYVEWHDTPLVPALFFGMKAAVTAIVFEAVFRIGRRALKSRIQVGLAAASFIAIFFFDAPFPAILAAAALVALAVGARFPQWFPSARHGGGNTSADDAVAIYPVDRRAAVQQRPTVAGSIRTAVVWSGLWWLPQGALAAMLGAGHVLVREGLFFSQTAVVTFGGAYSVLSYIAQRAVDDFHWLAPGEMLDGLGMAETTPGPLIMVVQFVGFLAAYREPAPFQPVAAGIAGSLVAVWVTFVPCFLWIFLGAPYIEALRRHAGLSRALSAVTAAVVGVILNLACWFALNVVFRQVDAIRFGPLRLHSPVWTTFDPAALTLSLAAAYFLLVRKSNLFAVLAATTTAGFVYRIAIAG